ncbi:DUF3108 domain-containing protein [Uliginosibacterium gangwonense]|uniref:DUF3108 domain-containing protein n=1 Tax=Uliginosibacterium gangwonense TaxID=392736 RepID=UPI00037CD661|nr:DUF3108 domain-containing protein [Uliginosibacterium gangwonense]
MIDAESEPGTSPWRFFSLKFLGDKKFLLGLAWGLSCLIHLLVVLGPGWDLPEPPGEARRIKAELLAVVPSVPAQGKPKQPRVAHRPSSTPSKNASRAVLPSEHAEDVPASESSTPVASTSAPVVAEASAPQAADSAPQVAVAQSEPVAQQSAPDELPLADLKPVAERLPRMGRIAYTGTASLLNVMGLVSWEHDGQHYKARLGAGIVGATSTFNYESSGILGNTQLVSEQAKDDRRGKHSTANIDNQNGVVRMQRGGDERERRISGLAVALSSLPEALACLDERIEKAALFIVGDFWVEDAVVINRGLEMLRLPGTTIEARRFQSKINNGKNIDIWLAPAWHNAPARIRYDDGGVVVDLKATEVDIDGQILLKAPAGNTE